MKWFLVLVKFLKHASKTSDFTLFMPSYIAFKNFAVLRGRAIVTTDKLIVEILKPTPKIDRSNNWKNERRDECERSF